MTNGEKDRIFSKHLLLVIILVAALLITEGLVFGLLRDSTDFSDILALTFGTFGAWIGAGAAYFFGRENLKSATESMLKITRTSKDILSGITIKEMNPRKIQTFKLSDKLADVLDWLKKDIWQFILAVTDEKDKFRYAIGEEAVYRYVMKEFKANVSETAGQVDQKIGEQTLKNLLEYYQSQDDEKLRGLTEYAAEISENITAAEASEKIEKSKKLCGVILNAERKPTGYITTNDIRRFMMNQ